jgi:hypothetical protein
VGQLMVALYRDGRQAEALDAFARLPQILRQDLLGIDPGAELRRVHEAILQQSPELACVLGCGWGRWPGGGISTASGRCLASWHDLTTQPPDGRGSPAGG